MPTAAPKSFKLEVFKSGTHTPTTGPAIVFDAARLQRIADNYNASANDKAPAVIGHPLVDDPAFGWISRLEYNAATDRMEAHVGDLEEQFAAMVSEKRFPKVSMSFFGPTHPSNPAPGEYYPRHLGFLGAAAPAIPGLKSVAFAAEEGDILVADFAIQAASAYSVKSILSGIRDYFIEKHGKEEAEKIIPSWSLDNLEISVQESTPSHVSPAYAATITETGVNTVPEATTTDFAAENARLRQQLADRDTADKAAKLDAAKADAASFCTQLVTDKRLAPADRAAVEATLVTLALSEPVSFASEGGTQVTDSPLAIMKRSLSAAPVLLETHEKAGGDGRTTPVAGPSFAAPDNAAVDTSSEEYKLWQRATTYATAHKVDFAAALDIVQADPNAV